MKRTLAFAVALLVHAIPGLARAGVEQETLCFSALRNDKIQLTLRYYLDAELNQQLGALARYGSSKALIPLVFAGDGTSDESLDWELHWLEVTGERITGRYSLAKPKSAPATSASLTYRNLRTRKETLFQPANNVQGGCRMTRAG